MARKRMIDPTIWADEDFGTLSSEAMAMYIGMISNADDEGRLPGNALYLSSTIFPFKGYDAKKSILLRDEILDKMKSLVLYSVDGKDYLQFKKWSSYQSINKPSESKYPPVPKDYSSATVGLPPNRIEENRIEKKGREEEESKYPLSYLSDIPENELEEFTQKFKCNRAMVKSKANEVIDYCKSKNKKYSDYKATLRNWLRKDFGERPAQPKQEQIVELSPEEKARASAKADEIRESMKRKVVPLTEEEIKAQREKLREQARVMN